MLGGWEGPRRPEQERLADLLRGLSPEAVELRETDDGRTYLAIELSRTSEHGGPRAAADAGSDQRVGGRKTISRAFGIEHDPNRALVYRSGGPVKLTRLEYGILRYLVTYPNRVITVQELLENAWRGSAEPNAKSDVGTLRTPISRLRKKLGDKDRRLVKNYYGMGYSFVPEPE